MTARTTCVITPSDCDWETPSNSDWIESVLNGRGVDSRDNTVGVRSFAVTGVDSRDDDSLLVDKPLIIEPCKSLLTLQLEYLPCSVKCNSAYPKGPVGIALVIQPDAHLAGLQTWLISEYGGAAPSHHWMHACQDWMNLEDGGRQRSWRLVNGM